MKFGRFLKLSPRTQFVRVLLGCNLCIIRRIAPYLSKYYQMRVVKIKNIVIKEFTLSAHII